jgi:hypothetical protein
MEARKEAAMSDTDSNNLDDLMKRLRPTHISSASDILTDTQARAAIERYAEAKAREARIDELRNHIPVLDSALEYEVCIAKRIADLKLELELNASLEPLNDRLAELQAGQEK